LTLALNIGDDFHGKMMGEGISVLDNYEKFDVVKSKRIGVTEDLDVPLRFYILNNEFVSRK
jgi:3-methyladenine DNA glycosylase Mpg